MLRRTVFIVLAMGLVVLSWACDKSAVPAANDTNAAVLPAGLVLHSPPADAKDVLTVRRTARDGDDVVIRGVVAGRKDPLAANRAIFTLLDPSIKTCEKMPEENCPTPWDACCSPSDEIASHSATVQVVDQSGKPLKAGLTGVAGLAPLKQVTVVGRLHTSPDGNAASIDATGIYVAQ